MFGLLGNLATCIVIINERFMRTTTNIYLFNLAVADILTLIIGNSSSTSTCMDHTNFFFDVSSSNGVVPDV